MQLKAFFYQKKKEKIIFLTVKKGTENAVGNAPL